MKINRYKKSRSKDWLLYVALIIIGLVFLLVGPIVINYIYLAEMRMFNLAFGADGMLKYYGAVLGGLVMAFTIVITIRINSTNLSKDKQRAQFERAYAIYHKLPEILAKLDIAAVHVRYSVHLSKQFNEDEVLIATLDTMEEARTLLREYNFINSAYYNKHIWELLQEIITASEDCNDKAERFLQESECDGKDTTDCHKVMEDAFSNLREIIKKAKDKITIEINKFIVESDEMQL